MKIQRIRNVDFRGSFDPSKQAESPTEKKAAALVDSVERRADVLSSKMMALDNIKSFVGSPTVLGFDANVGDQDPREGYVRLENFSATPGRSSVYGTLTPTSLDISIRTETNEPFHDLNGHTEQVRRTTEDGNTAEAYRKVTIEDGRILGEAVHYRSDFNGVISVEQGQG